MSATDKNIEAMTKYTNDDFHNDLKYEEQKIYPIEEQKSSNSSMHSHSFNTGNSLGNVFGKIFMIYLIDAPEEPLISNTLKFTF
jgi:hypothetical protein